VKLKAVVVMATVLCFAASAGWALVPDEYPPPGAEQAGVFEWNGTAWVAADPLVCQAYRLGDDWTYFCNGEYVNEATGLVEVGPIKLELEATVAQYLEAQLSREALTWYVLKPFDLVELEEVDRQFAVDSITLAIKSNGDVVIESAPIEDLVGVQGGSIPVKWAITTSDVPPDKLSAEWVGALTDPNYLVVRFPEDPAHNLFNWKIWNEIQTGKCTTACEYEGRLVLYLVLEEQKDWVVDKLGLQPGPRPPDP
jgi:hypothetical protein